MIRTFFSSLNQTIKRTFSSFFVFVCFNVSKMIPKSDLVHVIDFDFFMNYNMKIFYKFLAVFFHHGTFIAKKKATSNQEFCFYPPRSSDHIKFKWDNDTSLVGFVRIIREGYCGKIQKKNENAFRTDFVRLFFFS
jgi:hypothetical protein